MAINVQLKKKLGDFRLNISFESKSKRIGILGASGCGKSMTLKGIAGIETMDECYIEVENQVLADTKKKVCLSPQKRRVGYMFQNYALFPTQSVKKNIMAGVKGSKAERNAKAVEMMDKFELQGLSEHLPGELSGGQQQRVALARIMAYEPDVILLDEPFSALDDFLRDKLQRELMELLKNYEGTVILVSHNRDEIYNFSEELLVMDSGEIIRAGDKKEVFAEPQLTKVARLTGCKNIVSVKKNDEYTLSIPDWECELRLTNPISDDIKEIGYRAHDFAPLWGEQEENCIPCYVKSVVDTPFEQKYYLENKGEDISWFVQKESHDKIAEKGIPDFLKIVEDKILFLEN